MSGLSATTVDLAALIGFVELAGAPVAFAAFAAASLGAAVNYLVSKFWAFRDDRPIEPRQVAVFALVALATSGFVAASVHVLAVVLGVPYLLAKAISAGAVFLLWSYPAQAKLVFARRHLGQARALEPAPVALELAATAPELRRGRSAANAVAR